MIEPLPELTTEVVWLEEVSSDDVSSIEVISDDELSSFEETVSFVIISTTDVTSDSLSDNMLSVLLHPTSVKRANVKITAYTFFIILFL